MRRIVAVAMGCAMLFCAVANADTTVTVDPGAPWLGFMNVFTCRPTAAATNLAAAGVRPIWWRRFPVLC